jgi:hypothetical protein
MIRVCIDNVCTGAANPLRPPPQIPSQPATCSDPVVAVDKDGNIHVAFDRVSWQPDACVCSNQIYYLRYDASPEILWCTPVHVDSSGIGERNWAKKEVDRKGSDPAIAVSNDKTVHIAWTSGT